MAASSDVQEHARDHFDQLAAHYKVIEPDEIEIPTEATEETPAHVKVPNTDDEWLAPDADLKLSTWNSQGHIEILAKYGPAVNEGQFEFSGPPEPVVQGNYNDPDEGSDDTPTVKFVAPKEGESDDDPTRLETIELGTYRCERCGTHHTTGVRADGTPAEPGECPGCEREGPFNHAGGVDKEDLKAGQCAMKDGYWKAPSDVERTGDPFNTLWQDVRNHIERYWAAGDDGSWVYDALTAYAISTWLRENQRFVPHVLLRGATTGGKTRLLNTLARVSYRGMVSASVTPASMYRLIDAYNVTFFVSEYHGLHPDAQREVDNVVRAGQKRGESVTRAEPSTDGYEPMAFNPFAHIILASQYDPDDDIMNRCIQVRSSRPRDRDIPVDFEEATARDLRNRLLYARFCLLDSEEYTDAELDALEWLADKGIDGRTREKLLSLITVGRLWGRVDSLRAFVDEVVEQDAEAREESDDAMFIRAVRTLAHDAVGETAVLGDADPYGAVELPYADVAYQYAKLADLDPDRVSNTKMGHIRSRLGLEKDHKEDGSVISDPDLGPKLRELCEDFNVEWNPNDESGSSSRPLKPTMVRLVRDLYEDSTGPVSRPALKGEAENEGIDPDTAEQVLEILEEQGEIYREADDPPQYRPTN